MYCHKAGLAASRCLGQILAVAKPIKTGTMERKLKGRVKGNRKGRPGARWAVCGRSSKSAAKGDEIFHKALHTEPSGTNWDDEN